MNNMLSKYWGQSFYEKVFWIANFTNQGFVTLNYYQLVRLIFRYKNESYVPHGEKVVTTIFDAEKFAVSNLTFYQPSRIASIPDVTSKLTSFA